MHPPPTKLFNLSAANSSADLATMACHRAVATTAGSTPNILISFDGLAELLHGPTTKTPGRAPTVPAACVATDHSYIPTMSLAAFCEHYTIPEQLKEKLIKLGVQGLQALCWIKDKDLQGEGGLLLGELGMLQDAKQWWKKFSEW
jgi:hypothetical protein